MWIIVLALEGNCKSDVNYGIHVSSCCGGVGWTYPGWILFPLARGLPPWGLGWEVSSHGSLFYLTCRFLLISLGDLELLMFSHVHNRERYCCVWDENKRKSHLGCEPECIVRNVIVLLLFPIGIVVRIHVLFGDNPLCLIWYLDSTTFCVHDRIMEEKSTVRILLFNCFVYDYQI